MSITRKLLMSFFSIALVVAVLGVVSTSYNLSLKKEADRIGLSSIYEMEHATSINLEIQRVLSDVRKLMLESMGGDQKKFKQAREELNRTLPKLSESISSWENVVKKDMDLSGEKDGEKLKAVQDLKKMNGRLIPLVHRIAGLEGGFQDSRKLFEKKVMPLVLELSDSANILRKKVENEMQGRTQKARSQAHDIVQFGILSGVLTVLIVLSLGIFVWKNIVHSLKKLVKATEGITSGDLNVRVSMESRDEFAQLATSLNRMSSSMKRRTEELQTAFHEEMKSTQARLVQSEKMSAVGQLAAGVAHEINNPLGVIMGFAQGISRRVSPDDSLGMPLKSIEREAIRCKNLVQDLLTFSRAEGNKSEFVPVDLNKAIEGAMRLVKASAKVNSAEIKMELLPDIPHVLGNKNQIQQVVINLANNAIDAMPEGGTLQVTTEILKDQPFSWVCVKVSDTGEGIPHDMQAKVFEPFFTTKSEGKGTGLGLSLVFEIVTKHSGMIDLKSEPGSTEFCIKLPIRTG